MPVDPSHRQGKGRFPDAPQQDQLDQTFVDETLRRVETRTTFTDMIFMVVVGFWNMLRGFLKVEGGAKRDTREESE